MIKHAIVDISTKRVKDLPVKLTSSVISKALSRAKRYDIKDSSTTGFRLRISPAGSKTFIATGRVRGTPTTRTLTIGDASVLSVDDARKEAIQFLSKLQLGIDATQVKAEAVQREAKLNAEQLASQISLQDAMELYLADKKLKPATAKSYRYEIPFYCAEFLDMSIQDITEDGICKWYLSNKDRPASIDKAFRSLRAILEYAVATRVLTFNPCLAVTARKIRYKIQPRTRRIESHNLTAFIDSWIDLTGREFINPIQGDFILWLLMTGFRLDEARTLAWSDIDYETYTITIKDTKSGNAHLLPLTPLMKDLLDRRKKDNPASNPYVFPARLGRGMSDIKHLNDCRKSLDAITNNAQIPQVRPHDLRRTFATMLDELNISESNIKSLLNHNDGSVTSKHYLQQTDMETKRTNLWAVGKHLEMAATIKALHPVTNEECIWGCTGTIRNFVYGTDDLEFIEVKGSVSKASLLDGMR